MDHTKRNINKKVIIAIPCLLRGGTEQQTLLLVKALVESSYNVEVCCYFEYDEDMVTEFKAAGAAVLLLGWSRAIGTIKFIRSLATIFRERSPYIVHVQYMAPGFLPIIAARLAKLPIIFSTVHQPGTTHGFKAHFLLRFGAMLTNRFTCVSEAAEKSWFGDSCLLDHLHPEMIFGRKHLTIPNAVDIGGIDKLLAIQSPKVAKTAAHLKGRLVVGTVARLSREKGIDILLEAFAKVHKEEPQSHLLIIGSGEQLADLKELANSLGIGNLITWMGKLPWKDAIEYLGSMDVVVMPSRFEGFGLSAVEAMACSKPVVASHVDGLAEVIQDGATGMLVSSEDPLNLASTLIALLKDKERRQKIGNSARKHVEEKYAYPMFRERIRALYEGIRLKTEG